MQITLFGASGKVGRLVVPMLIERGHKVVAFVHGKSPFGQTSNLVIIKGDVHNEAVVMSAIEGSAIVLSTLGSWGTPQKDILASAMRTIVPALEKSAAKRLITLTGAEARLPGDAVGSIHRGMHALLAVGAKDILRDSELHAEILRASTLDWTIVRSPIMNNVGGDGYSLSDQRPLPWSTINRNAVVKALVDQIDDERFYRQAPFISRQ